MEYQNSCAICTEKYNKSSRCKTECDYCNFQACNSCWQTYFLNETVPKCMNKDCEKEWTTYQMRRKFSQVFMNTKYKKHIINVINNVHNNNLVKHSFLIVVVGIIFSYTGSYLYKKFGLYINNIINTLIGTIP